MAQRAMGVGKGDLSSLGAPEPLTAEHDLSLFACGEVSLDDWPRRRAWANQASGASRTYVTAQGARVVGYYSLASGGIAVSEAPTRLRRNMQDPIPMTLMGRLGVDRAWQGQRLGALLLRDAILRTAQAASIIGIRGLLVHALSTDTKRFYERWGFREAPGHPMTLVVSPGAVVGGWRREAEPLSLADHGLP